MVRMDKSGATPNGMISATLDFPEVMDSLLSNRSASGKKCLSLWEPKFKGDLRSAITGGQWTQSRLAATRQWTDTSLCQLCQGATGTLQHRRECPATRPHEGWPVPPPAAQRLMRTLSAARCRLLTTRGLFTLRVMVPAPPNGDTFSWHVPLPENIDQQSLTWYIDGSLFDEAKRIFRRTGFGIAVVDAQGSLVAFGNGIPPPWILDAAGAELWALYFVLSVRSEGVPRIVTDCKGILDGAQCSPAHLVGHDRALARTWGLIIQVLDGELQPLAERLLWMPSHESAATLARATDSGGRPITLGMWRANRLVDALAKLAARKHRLPAIVKQKLDDASTLLRYQAALLGVVTHAANNHRVEQVREDGTTVTIVQRDSTADRQQPRSFKVRPPKPTLDVPAPAVGSLAGGGPSTSQTCSGDRGRKRRMMQQPTLQPPARRSRAHALQQHLLRADLAAEEQVARHIASRDLRPSTGPGAAERLQAVRDRRMLRRQ